MKINIQMLGDTYAHGELTELQKHLILNQIQYMKVHNIHKITKTKLENVLFYNSAQSSKNFTIENDDKNNAKEIMKEVAKYE